jgi:GDP-mannose 4,6 dehydratase
MTYAANPHSLEPVIADNGIVFVKGDFNDVALIRSLFEAHRFTRVAHLAAESPVDRPIDDTPRRSCRPTCWEPSPCCSPRSTIGARREPPSCMCRPTRVYGSLGPDDPAFSEASPYQPCRLCRGHLAHRALVSRPGGKVARDHLRRLPGLDRQELRLPERGLENEPAEQRLKLGAIALRRHRGHLLAALRSKGAGTAGIPRDLKHARRHGVAG